MEKKRTKKLVIAKETLSLLSDGSLAKVVAANKPEFTEEATCSIWGC